MKKTRLASVALAAVFTCGMVSESLAIMACGNRWQPVSNGIGQNWGLDPFDGVGRAPTPGASMGILPPYNQMLQGGAGFTAADYSVDCSVLLPERARYVTDLMGRQVLQGIDSETYACRINKAPTVDMNFVSNLRAQGYTTSLVYPRANNGSNNGMVTWAKLSNGFNRQCPAGMLSYNDGDREDMTPHSDKCAVDQIGFAYVTGAGWAPPVESVYTAAIDQMALSPADRSSAVVAGFWGPHPSVKGSACPFQETKASAVVFFGQPAPPPPPPPLPAAPPPVPGRNANAVNFGQQGRGFGTGGAGVGQAEAMGTAPFDYVAYCSAPGRGGKPRSQAWIDSCLSAINKQ